jgi:dTMP kinase
MFITFEGGDGAGKTTQVRRLAAHLREEHYAIRETREPGGTPLANAFRALLLHPEESLRALTQAHLTPEDEHAEQVLPITEVFLLSAGRAQHVARIREWLAADEIVISDRYADATRVYQGAARGLDQSVIFAAERLATGGLVPDLTFLLDLPVEEGLRRRHEAHANGDELNRLDRETVAFHERVRAGYLALAESEPTRWVVLDATRSPDQLAVAIWEAVTSRLRLHQD